MFNIQGSSQPQFNIQGSNAQGSPPSGAVLLIGSTGNGKSTLGNFLFDPSPNVKKCFEVTRDNRSITTCKAETRIIKYRQEKGSSDTPHDTPHDTFSREIDTFEDTLGAQSSTFDQSKAVVVLSKAAVTTRSTGFMKDIFNNKVSKLASVKKEDNEMSGSLTIIDTPGVNEGGEKDLEHMIDFINTLKEQQIFKACIFVQLLLISSTETPSSTTLPYCLTCLSTTVLLF